MILKIVIVLLLSGVSIQGFRPKVPSKPRVDWGTVTGTSFVISWTPVHDGISHRVILKRHGTDYVEMVKNVTAGVSSITLQDEDEDGKPKEKPTVIIPWAEFNVYLYAINEDGEMSFPTERVFVKLRWTYDYVSIKRWKAIKVEKDMVPQGKCAKGRFTCADDNTRCLPYKWWCNGRRQCSDGSDERGCPGGCPEIFGEVLANGNWSCTLWGSPNSRCWFSCDPGYTLDGSLSTKCTAEKRTWSRNIPICRVNLPGSVYITLNGNLDLTVHWKRVEYAVSYVVVMIPQTKTLLEDYKDGEAVKQSVYANHLKDEEKLKVVFDGVGEHDAYRIVLYGVDGNNEPGMQVDEVFLPDDME